ncbi:hypothetical protein EYC84_011354 [Monilinia fructicola]|uniref:Uncharacterized protein n=1 Tax=Monilinia fructicola TaxID=38448 RepID=A0A5M9J9T9_MONFR|nr:hypothetical protein EYC84_011354 [Monilinia fructicola]
MASGVSIVAASTLPPTLAALPESNVATASGMYPFLRSFSYICGVTAPPIVLDGQIQKYAQRIGNADVQAQSANKAGGIWAGERRVEYDIPFRSQGDGYWGICGRVTDCVAELRQELDTVYVYGLDEGSKDKTNGDSEAGGHDMVPLATLKQAQQEI